MEDNYDKLKQRVSDLFKSFIDHLIHDNERFFKVEGDIRNVRLEKDALADDVNEIADYLNKKIESLDKKIKDLNEK